ncbi:cache domain-containing sensor histidine kinase [Paenibacillus spongiae]|uniref:histidine kinase n=1 Tax=Paenibacillus spongiae TaxID=2909671 RepID=A0ABY5SMB1_9BACL|nr:sensor histidine kinase [Paenibacillus spongiae]UVI33660.1 sensor histidine kinase [Paenibacillus spongiae]
MKIGRLLGVWHYFRSFKLRNKLLICFGLIIALTVLNISYFTYNKTENYLNQLSSGAYREVLRQANVTLDYRMKNYERVLNTFYISEEFQELLTNDYANKFDEYEANNRLRDFIESILNTYEYVPIVKVYNFKESTFSGFIYKESDIVDEAWKQEIVTSPSLRILWSNRFTDTHDKTLLKLVAAKALRNKFNKVYGIVSFEINSSYMFNQIDHLDLFPEGNVYVLDQSGLLVYRQNSRVAERVGDPYRLYSKLTGNSGSFTETIDGVPYFIVYDKSTEGNWTLVGATPMRGALSITKDVRDYILVLSILLIVIGFVVIYGMSYFFTKRLSLLTDEMLKVSKGAMNIQLDMRSNDEIGEMNKVLHLMLRKMMKNMDDISEMKTTEAKLQMKTLQMQINPHFLYNTLSTINWMAMNAGAEDISEAVNALAKYYRIGLSNGKEIITIREELEHVRNYIYIQQIRTKDNIKFEYDVDEEALPYLTPKMILQPIVENAIYHGIEKIRKTGTIRIAVKKYGTHIRFTVEDNGSGIDESKLNDQLNGYAAKSYGLYNIESKIKLYFGQEYGLQVDSIPGRGTSVTIDMPASMNM